MNIFHRLTMELMVRMMRVVTRYLPFIAHPFVAWVAEQEVIACGLRAQDGSVRFIFTPTPWRGEHRIVKRSGQDWNDVVSEPVEDFSVGLVQQLKVSETQNGEQYRVVAPRISNGRLVRSPKITIKPETKRVDEILSVEVEPSKEARISWRTPKGCEAMVYFLTVEDETGRALTGIYTRETFWVYPRTNTASLSVGQSTPELEAGKTYTARLIIVDFDGWVDCSAEQSFLVTK